MIKYKCTSHDGESFEMLAKKLLVYLSKLSFTRLSKTVVVIDSVECDGHKAESKLKELINK